jgi:hypothetical protein
MGVNIMWKTASFLSLYGGGLFSIGQLCTLSILILHRTSCL